MISILHSTWTHIHTHKHTHVIIFSEKFTESLRIEKYCLIYFQKLGGFYFLGVIYIPHTHTCTRARTLDKIYKMTVYRK